MPESLGPFSLPIMEASGFAGKNRSSNSSRKSRSEPGLDHHIASRYALLASGQCPAYIKQNQTSSRVLDVDSLKVDPSFESLRTNPKFQELANQMTPSGDVHRSSVSSEARLSLPFLQTKGISRFSEEASILSQPRKSFKTS